MVTTVSPSDGPGCFQTSMHGIVPRFNGLQSSSFSQSVAVFVYLHHAPQSPLGLLQKWCLADWIYRVVWKECHGCLEADSSSQPLSSECWEALLHSPCLLAPHSMSCSPLLYEPARITRLCKVQTHRAKTVLLVSSRTFAISFEGDWEAERVQQFVHKLQSHCAMVSRGRPANVPWFPRCPEDLDKIASQTLDAG